MELFEMVRRALLAGLGVQDKVKELVEDLVAKGELNESQGAKLVKEWTDKAKKSSSDINLTFSDLIHSALERMKLPTKEDTDKINKNLKNLTARVKKLEEKIGE
jgi:polyhydroxyalkanoate synthesis regulator phasin